MSVYSNKRFDAKITNREMSEGVDKKFRNSTLFFPRGDQFPKTFNILQSTIIGEYGNRVPFVNLNNIAEIQYARYDVGNFFKRHRDVIFDHTELRRAFTFSVNLSEKDDYGDGELLVYDDDNEEVDRLDKEIGSFIVFPSFFQHEALEVTSGVREAIVTWIHTQDESYHRMYNSFYANQL